jgi:adenosylhomocysteinase
MEMAQPISSLEGQLKKYEFAFPILTKLSAFLEASAHLKGKRIGWHCHLTGLTAASAQVLIKAGAELIMSECTASTTDWAAVKFMKQLGAKVYQDSDSPRKVLDHKPELISDTGFVLSTEYLKDLEAGQSYVYGGCEITTSGIHKMRQLAALKFPVININDGELKTLIENYHGVGDGVVEALFRLTGRMWSGRSAAVIGYGRVGAGVANYLRKAGAAVHVVELDPIRRLVAHYDGFCLLTLEQSLRQCELIVTASGCLSVIGYEQLRLAKDGMLLMNVGHWAEEIDLAGIRTNAVAYRQVSNHLDEYEIADGDSSKRIYLIGSGGPANVVMLSGSPEPTLIHLTTEILCLNHLSSMQSKGAKIEAGEIAVPTEVQRQASILALQSLGLD